MDCLSFVFLVSCAYKGLNFVYSGDYFQCQILFTNLYLKLQHDVCGIDLKIDHTHTL